jgi:DNA-binding NarL/FixJ family response regulator
MEVIDEKITMLHFNGKDISLDRWDVFLLREITNGIKIKDIAKAQHMKSGTVQVQVYRLVERIEKLLDLKIKDVTAYCCKIAYSGGLVKLL